MGSFDIFPLAFSISWDQQKGKGTKAELMLCFCLHHCLSTWQELLGRELSICHPSYGHLTIARKCGFWTCFQHKKEEHQK